VADDRGRLSPGPPRRRGLVEQHPPARVLPLGRLAVDQGAGLPPPRARIASSDAMSSIDDRSPGGSPTKTLRITRRRILPLRVFGRRGITWTAAGLNGLPSDRSTLRETAASMPGMGPAKLPGRDGVSTFPDTRPPPHSVPPEYFMTGTSARPTPPKSQV